MAKASYYEILGVATTATTDEVRATYRRLAREHHPDRVRDPSLKAVAEERFTAMTEASNVLSDATRRSEYDRSLREQVTGETSIQRDARGYLRAGQVMMSENKPKEAIRAFKAAVHLDSSQGTYYAHLARALEADRALGEAARVWEEAIQREPHNAMYYRSAGQVFERAGMAIRARKMYESALQWNPNDTVASEALSRFQEDGKKTSRLGGLFKRS